MFHHLCQTEWEIHQYHLDYPNGKPQDCVYDSGGKKRCVQHHPHGNLAVNPPLADQSQEDGWSPASSEDEDLDDNQSGYTGPVFSMFGHLKSLQTNKVDEMGASDNADTSTQLQGNERNDSQVRFQKYPKGSLVLKTFDSDEISGFVKSFDTQTGVYTVQWSDDTEDLLTECPMKHLIVESTGDDISKQPWIPCKDQHVFVKVGKTLHEARIESAIPNKPGHVVVRWHINNKTETVDLKDVTPCFSRGRG